VPAPVRASWLQRGAQQAELGWTDTILDPDVLTIGFARRVPTYKRLTLMLRDPERLKRCCCTRASGAARRSRARRTPPTTAGRS
jgi:glucan phosphorylase